MVNTLAILLLMIAVVILLYVSCVSVKRVAQAQEMIEWLKKERIHLSNALRKKGIEVKRLELALKREKRKRV